jgi:hypothetical protein
MDPSNPTRSSPPQLIVDCQNQALKTYRELHKRLRLKKHALSKLEQKPPRSITTKMTLHVSKLLDGTAEATTLRDEFNSQLNTNTEALAKTVKKAAELELKAIEQKLQQTIPNAITEMHKFYEGVHNRLAHGNNWPTFQPNEVTNPSMAVTGFQRARAQLETELIQLRFTLAVEDEVEDRKRAELEAKRAQAMELESTTPSSEMVSSLVRTAVRQQVGPLKKQINELQRALNSNASRKGASTGTKRMQPQQPKPKVQPTKKQGSGNDNAKVAGGGRGSAKDASKQKPTKPKNANKQKPKKPQAK